MINAYILVAMQPGYSNHVVDEIIKIDEVMRTSVIAGDFDIVVRVAVANLDQLHQTSTKIQQLHGVKNTVTCVIEKELVL